jgi:hypothetical protein
MAERISDTFAPDRKKGYSKGTRDRYKQRGKSIFRLGNPFSASEILSKTT